MPYFDPVTAESEDAHYLKVAADLVQRFAPVPDPVPGDYAAKAARAERLLLNYLTSTSGGLLTSASISAGSLSFADIKVVKGIVRTTMVPYYTAGQFSTAPIERA